MRFFGKKKPEPAKGPTLEEANASMDTRVQSLKEKVSECDRELVQLREAIKNSRGSTQQMNKQRAVQLLKRRKMYASQLEGLMGTQFNIEQMTFTAQSIQDTINTVTAMKEAHKVQTQQLKQLKVGDVEKMMDDMADMMMDTEEINEIMSRNYACEVDEGELERELDELDEADLFDDLNRESMEVPSYLPKTQEKNAEMHTT
jgi:charged multivesicular body protein 5